MFKFDQACQVVTYGFNYNGFNTAWLGGSYNPAMDQIYEWVPYACDIIFNQQSQQQPYCNLKTDP